jgi:GAF domain-containing protein
MFISRYRGQTYAYKFTALLATILNNLDMPTSRELTDEVLISHAHELRRRAIQGDMQARELAHEYEIELRIRLRQRTAEAAGNRQASSIQRPDLQSRVTDGFSKPAASSAVADDISSQVVKALLQNARELLEMDIVFTTGRSGDPMRPSQVNAAVGTIATVQGGPSASAADSGCERALEGRLTAVVADRAETAKSCDAEAARMPEIGAYLSAPVILPNGEIYGTLCCVSHRPRSALGNRQVDALRTVAALVSTEIDKIRRMSAA